MDFSPDITRFIELRFRKSQVQQVVELLSGGEFTTPRVLRSILFLSNGSMSLLQHAIAEAKKDVRAVLVEAEYITGVSEEPLLMRDMSLPFQHPRNLDSDGLNSTDTAATSVTQTLPPRRTSAVHHKEILGCTFSLGSTDYRVSARQPSRAYVCCQRKNAERATAVKLPLVFVLEQLAETVEFSNIESNWV